jgi:hypothetical protein
MTPQLRGTIIKTPDNAPGLLVVAGQQKTFTLEGIWKSAAAPMLNMAVDVEFDGSGFIKGLTAVDPQQAAREKLNQIGGAAQQRGKEAAEIARQGIGALAARMGKFTLGAAVVLWIAWFFMPTLTIGENLTSASKSFTFWELVGLDPNTNIMQTSASYGLFGLLGLLAIAAPFASPFIRNSKAKLLYAAPLVYVVIGYFVIQSDFNAFFAHIFGATLTDASKWLSFSFGYGAYILAAASLLLAIQVLSHPGYENSGSAARPSAGGAVYSESGSCTKCGKPLSAGEDYCTNCGAKRTALAGS